MFINKLFSGLFFSSRAAVRSFLSLLINTQNKDFLTSCCPPIEDKTCPGAWQFFWSIKARYFINKWVNVQINKYTVRVCCRRAVGATQSGCDVGEWEVDWTALERAGVWRRLRHHAVRGRGEGRQPTNVAAGRGVTSGRRTTVHGPGSHGRTAVRVPCGRREPSRSRRLGWDDAECHCQERSWYTESNYWLLRTFLFTLAETEQTQ